MVINSSSLSKKQKGLAQLRKQLLETEGFIAEEVVARKQNSDYGTYTRKGKSRAMVKIEEKVGLPIEEILAGDKWAKDISKELGITVSTVSNWRKRLGIVSEYSMNKLMEKVQEKIDGG